MQCVCEECRGSGEIPCPECDGSGGVRGNIQDIRLHGSIHNYEELIELQKDAKRVIRQAARLQTMKPERSKSYAAQLEATLFVINGQAERAAKTKKGNQ